MSPTLNIQKKYFNLIQNNKKTIELRLYDEKRKLIKINDVITLICNETNEELKAKVIKLYRAKNFDELVKIINIENTGFRTLKELKDNMLQFYTVEKQNTFGVLGIQIELVQ